LRTYTGLTLHKLSASQTQGETSESWSITYLYDEYGKPYAGVYRSPSTSTAPVVFGLVTTDRGDVVELLDSSGNAFAAYRYDAWGNPLGEMPAASVVRHEEGDALLSYQGTWTTTEDAAASTGSFACVDATGASVTVEFTGTSLAWITSTAPDQGIASLTLDEGTPQMVDLYSAEPAHQQSVWDTGTLTEGAHTVLIEWTGTKNEASSGTTISVDALDVTAVPDTGQVSTGVWAQATVDDQQSEVISLELATIIAQRQVLRYAGYCYDSESALYYLSARHYDPATRQFLSKDLSRNDGEQSAYQYCLGNPVGGTDPTGYRVPREDRQLSRAERARMHNRVNEELARSKSENRLSTVDKIGNWLNKYCHPRGWGSLAANANDPSSAILYDFVTGAGPRERYFGASNQQAQEMMGTTSMRSVWRRFQLEGAVDEKFAYDTYVAWGETVLGRKDTPSFPYTTAPAQVGGYAGATIDNNGDGTATVTIKNDAGLHSFTNGVLWNWPKETGPYSTIHQTFQWTWPIDYKPEQ
jgi:RHS repeat-associated protein